MDVNWQTQLRLDEDFGEDIVSVEVLHMSPLLFGSTYKWKCVRTPFHISQ